MVPTKAMLATRSKKLVIRFKTSRSGKQQGRDVRHEQAGAECPQCEDGEVRTVCEVLGHEAGEAPGQKEQMVA